MEGNGLINEKVCFKFSTLAGWSVAGGPLYPRTRRLLRRHAIPHPVRSAATAGNQAVTNNRSYTSAASTHACKAVFSSRLLYIPRSHGSGCL